MASNYCIKQIDIEKFIEAFNGWTHGKYSLNKASKIMGVNWEITKKYFVIDYPINIQTCPNYITRILFYDY